MTQTFHPDKIILYLSRPQFAGVTLPSTLMRFVKYGLTIRYLEGDIRSYKKLIPALREFPDDIIVAYDDDLYFPSESLERLVTSFRKDPTVVHTHRARLLPLQPNGFLHSPRVEWWKIYCAGERPPCASPLIFSEGAGGALYPPHVLHPNVLNEDEFTRIAPMHDDLWFWGMTVLNNRSVLLVENPLGPVNISGRAMTPELCSVNIGRGFAARQADRLFHKYRFCLMLMEERRRRADWFIGLPGSG
jgi:hypothetical protein